VKKIVVAVQITTIFTAERDFVVATNPGRETPTVLAQALYASKNPDPQ
jgi:hypothetical protein